MAYSIKEAKDLVISAGKMLVESGLIARTWGNISARISDTHFVISPSGLAYETLTPDQVVTVNIADCTYEGNIKPSSEKGIHADVYRIRKEVNFIIHTHQEKASVISIEGEDLNIDHREDQRILGEIVPCAAYGMSSTSKLRKAVAAAVSHYSRSTAVLMKYHGTLCMGKDLNHSFEIARTLEKVAEEKYQKACRRDEIVKDRIIDYGSSERRGDMFILKWNGKSDKFMLGSLPEGAPEIALLHASIYKSNQVDHIIHSKEEEVIEVSSGGRMLRPYLDDLAQIAGINIKLVKNGLGNTKAVAKKLKHRNAVLLKDAGALCTGKTESDANAVAMVLKKGCAADLYSNTLKKPRCLGIVDAYIQRTIYVAKYSKQKK